MADARGAKEVRQVWVDAGASSQNFELRAQAPKERLKGLAVVGPLFTQYARILFDIFKIFSPKMILRAISRPSLRSRRSQDGPDSEPAKVNYRSCDTCGFAT